MNRFFKHHSIFNCLYLMVKNNSRVSKMNFDWALLKEGTDFSEQLGKYGIIILNRAINMNPDSFKTFWMNAKWRITVDGGSDRWLAFTKLHNLSLPLPNQVTGDMDSIKPETLEFFKEQAETEVIYTPDQDFTDFCKAVKILNESCPELNCFLALGENSGRIDQTFSNLNVLSKYELQGYIMTTNSLSWLLLPGNHCIHIPSFLRKKTEWCGILPFHPARIKSTGLKWNLDNLMVEFGGLISSSNTYDGSPEVTITNDRTVIWTMSLGKVFA